MGNPLKSRHYRSRGTNDREGVEDFTRQVLAVTLQASAEVVAILQWTILGSNMLHSEVGLFSDLDTL